MDRNPREFNCATCTCDKSRGFDAGWPKWKIDGLLESRYCLRQITPQRYFYLLKLWRFYRQGVLPLPGGLLGQPAFYLDAMNFIDIYVGSLDNG